MFSASQLEKSVISKFATSNENGIIKPNYIDILEKNDLIIHNCDQQTLMPAISISLYSSDTYASYIQALCFSLFKKTIAIGHTFKSRISAVSEYLINPQHPQFDFLNLELISLIFKVKILVYVVEEDELIASIVNHGFSREVAIFRNNLSYCPLFTKSFHSKFSFVKRIINQIVSKVLQDQQNDLQSSPQQPKRQFKRCQSIPEEYNQTNYQHPSLDIISQIHSLQSQQQISLTCEKPIENNQPAFSFSFQDSQPMQFYPPFLISDQYLYNVADNIALAQQQSLSYGPITPLQKQSDSKAFNYSQYDQQQFGWKQPPQNPVKQDNLVYNNNNSSSLYNDPLMKTFQYNPEKDSQSANKIKPQQGKQKLSDQLREEDEESKLLEDIYKKTQPQIQATNQGERSYGRLKFFDENKQYGFFVNEKDKSDVFVHLDDMQKSGIQRDIIRKLKQGYMLYFSFQSILYQGKSKQNVKAVDIKFESMEAPQKR